MLRLSVIICVVLIAALTAPVTVLAEEVQSLPEYKIEDLTLMQTIYVEVETGKILVSPKETKGQYCISKKYIGDGIILYEMLISERRVKSFSTGKEYIYPPYKNHRLYYQNRVFVDYVDENGNDGADGKYEKAYPY